MVKNIKISTELAKELYKKNDSTINKILLENFDKSELEEVKVNCWADFKEYIYNETDFSHALPYYKFKTLEDSQAMCCFIKLKLLRDHFRGVWEPDHTYYGQSTETKYYIYVAENDHVSVDESYLSSHFLEFETEQQAKSFADMFNDLILMAKDLIG